MKSEEVSITASAPQTKDETESSTKHEETNGAAPSNGHESSEPCKEETKPDPTPNKPIENGSDNSKEPHLTSDPDIVKESEEAALDKTATPVSSERKSPEPSPR